MLIKHVYHILYIYMINCKYRVDKRLFACVLYVHNIYTKRWYMITYICSLSELLNQNGILLNIKIILTRQPYCCSKN